jgi:hypothetical protein
MEERATEMLRRTSTTEERPGQALIHWVTLGHRKGRRWVAEKGDAGSQKWATLGLER